MADIENTMTINVKGVHKDVQWHRGELGIAVALADIIKLAQTEFPDLSMDELIISGCGDPDQNNVGMEYSQVTLAQKSGWE